MNDQLQDLSDVQHSGPTVLIVDDDAQVRSLLSRIIQRSNQFSTIWEAEDAAEGVFQARHHSPDIILLDYDMPWMNAGATRRYLKDFVGAVVVVSGVVRKDIADWADAFVPKSSLGELVPVMTQALKGRSASSRL